MRGRWMTATLLVLGILVGGPGSVWVATAQPSPATPGASIVDRTPPRLSLTDGQVSFWRPGAQDWVQAQVNTPLAPGDELSTGSPGSLEIQTGGRAFVRAWAGTQLGLANEEPDFLQFTVTNGHVSVDLRTVEPGQTVEVDTPNAAFSLEHPGYYRVDVIGERTTFITRRAGQATLTPAGGQPVSITPSEEVVIEGTTSPQVAAFAAPPLDDWDRWNYTRTDALLDAVSARYVAPGAYGVSDLDRYGDWRVVPTYGAVWVPRGVPAGWAPYSTGAWTVDPVYGWTWVDTAPWGWAPFHYGRWCFVDGFWAWAPGPIVALPVYAPALVTFFDAPSLGVGGPVVGWVALGWGEPLVPWWGREGFIHVPSWRGWGGPHVVNNVTLATTTVVNIQSITVYRNVSVPNAVVAVPETRFGRGPITTARIAKVEGERLHLTHTAPPVAATPASFVPTTSPGHRPPPESLGRAVVATRPPQAGHAAAPGGPQPPGPTGITRPAPHLVTAPKPHDLESVPQRPSFGRSPVERPMADRAPTPAPPKLVPLPAGPAPAAGHAVAPPPPARHVETSRGTPAGPPPTVRSGEASGGNRPAPGGPTPPTGHPAGPPPTTRHAETSRPPARPLPGEPANHLAPHRVQGGPPQQGQSGG